MLLGGIGGILTVPDQVAIGSLGVSFTPIGKTFSKK